MNKKFSETIAFWKKMWYNIFIGERYSSSINKMGKISMVITGLIEM